MKLLKIACGKYVKVDDDVFNKLPVSGWWIKCGYDIDHINRDKLDNRKCNLRIISRSRNNFNSGLRKNNTSGFKGVSWDRQKGKWRVYIGGTKNRIEIGFFDKIGNAVRARKKAQLLYYPLW